MATETTHRTSHALSLVVLVLAIATLAGTASSLAVSDRTADDRLDLLRTMAELDRAYIPALWWTGQKDRERASTAIDRLHAVWMGVEPILTESPLLDGASTEELEAVRRSIARGASLVDGDGDLHEAHEALEEIRLDTLELRRRNDIPYFLDRLTEYHEPMEAIVLAAVSGDDSAVDRIRELAPQARSSWRAVEDHPFDNRVYRLERHELHRRERAVAEEAAALDTLEAALAASQDGGDPTAILAAARGIKPPFTRLVLLFGGLKPGERPSAPTGPANDGGTR